MQLDYARTRHPDEAVDGAQRTAILVLFALVTPFWSLFDQRRRRGCCKQRT
jgi:hypothetical protein